MSWSRTTYYAMPVISGWINHNTNPEDYPRSERKARSIHFKDAVLYSATIPIAKFVETAWHDWHVLIRKLPGCDQTVERHIWRAHSTLNEAGIQRSWVREIGEKDWSGAAPPLYGARLHIHNAEDMLAAMEDTMERCIEEWWSGDSYWKTSTEKQWDDIQAYCHRFNIEPPTQPFHYYEIKVSVDRHERYCRYYDPKIVRKRERAQARRLAAKAFGYEDET